MRGVKTNARGDGDPEINWRWHKVTLLQSLHTVQATTFRWAYLSEIGKLIKLAELIQVVKLPKVVKLASSAVLANIVGWTG